MLMKENITYERLRALEKYINYNEANTSSCIESPPSVISVK